MICVPSTIDSEIRWTKPQLPTSRWQWPPSHSSPWNKVVGGRRDTG